MSRSFPKHYTRMSMICFVLLLMASFAAQCATNDIKQEMSGAVTAVRPSLIRIHVVSTAYDQGREIKTESYGSGVIISPEGYAVTNHHVAMDAETLVVTLADKREVDAKLVGTDALADIAVIRLISPDGKPFPFTGFGDSSKLEVGDRVFAMGSPYAISQSVTMGMVSNTEMMLPDYMGSDAFSLDGEDVGTIVRWIGHDAFIAPGNSGGPLVSREGQIVGINEIDLGLSGAIPSNLAKHVADQIIKNGKVSRSWLGIEVQPVLESSKLKKGVLVSGILPDSPAEKAEFKSGDIILSVNNEPMIAQFREQIPLINQFMADLPVGKPAAIRVLRDGKELTLTATTVERQKAWDDEHELRSWGITASNITYLMQRELQIDSQDGVLVSSILPSGPAGSAKPPLRFSDVIVRVGGEAVKDIDDLRTVTKKVTEGKDDQVPVVVEFNRGKKLYATVIRVGKPEASQPGSQISKAWLPVDMQVLTRELAEGLGVADKTGVRVTQVYPDSSAEKAGLKVGDLILKLDGEVIPADQIGDEEVLPALIRQYDIGSEVELGILRDGKDMKLKLALEASPKPTRDYPRYENDSFEFSARDIAFSDRVEGSLPKDQKGAYVLSVTDGSWASLGGLRSGDIISNIGSSAVGSLDDLKRVIAEIEQKKPENVVFKVQRGIHTLFLEIKPNWADMGI